MGQDNAPGYPKLMVAFDINVWLSLTSGKKKKVRETVIISINGYSYSAHLSVLSNRKACEGIDNSVFIAHFFRYPSPFTLDKAGVPSWPKKRGYGNSMSAEGNLIMELLEC